MKPGKGIGKAVLSAPCLAAIPGVAQFRDVRKGLKINEWVISVTLREVSHHSGQLDKRLNRTCTEMPPHRG